MTSFFNQDIIFKLNRKRHYRLWIKELFLKHQKLQGTINVIFCSNSYILELNRYFLRHDYCTDVITFDYSHTFSKNRVTGDIFISVDTVRSNFIEYGAESFEEELQRVIAHGVLHLLGYNDVTFEEKSIMRDLEDAAIKLYKGF